MNTFRCLCLRLLIVSVIGSLFSCKDENWIEDTVVSHYPRECTQVVTLPLLYGEEQRKGGNRDEIYTAINLTSLKSGAEVSSNKFLLYLATGADDMAELRKTSEGSDYEFYDWYSFGKIPEYTQYADRIPALEEELEEDRSYKSKYSQPFLRAASLDYTNLVLWTYRVTGVKNFRIEALESLFGQSPETSLNEYFGIYEFYPRQIISHRTKELVWGYRDKDEVKTIDEWLSLEPMAPPSVKFHLLSTPPEAPLDVHFVSILETTDGKELRDTLAVRLLP